MKRYVALLLALMLVLLSACRQAEPEIPSAPESAASEEDLLSSTDAESTETESTESAESIASEPKPEPSEPATPSQAVPSAPSADTVADSLARHRLTPAIDYTSLESQKPSDEFLSSVADFSYRASATLLSSQEGNSVFCPISLYYPLALLTTAAQGNTREELVSALGVSHMTNEQLALECARLFASTRKEQEETLFLNANSLWFPMGETIRSDFAQTAAKRFYASIHGVTFGDPMTDREMAQWVSDNTKGLIQPTIQTDTDTRMILCNTVYIKSAWTDQFSLCPEPMDFTTQSGQTLKTEFLSNRYDGKYTEGENYVRVDLGVDHIGTMSFILPKEGLPISDLMTASKLKEMTSPLKGEREILLKIPKVDIEGKANLLEVLSNLGIHDAMDPYRAQFSLFENQQNPHYIAKADQQARLLWDENGMEAAAFTQIVIDDGCYVPTEPIQVTLDRPFLFLLHSDAGILFAGACQQPK